MSDVVGINSNVEIPDEEPGGQRIQLDEDGRLFLIRYRTVSQKSGEKMQFMYKVKIEIDGVVIWYLQTNAPNGFDREALSGKIRVSRGLKQAQKDFILAYLPSQSRLNT
jgi:hypothetical protein